MNIKHLDHFVLTVADIPTSVAFFQSVMGMNAVTFGEGRVALEYGQQKINLHQLGREFEPKARHVQAGSADLCFIIEGDLASAMQHVRAQNVNILEGPITRTGAQGPITSFYFRDPDGNLIECSVYES
ncbi:VOC family protein [Vibrio pelagius]|uniref:VOC family protein n=1 Tax=Vibrio pelagius TaxID=28169 RepID=UPI0021C329D7|nr:VOC family protein [Vibrio pelagius]